MHNVAGFEVKRQVGLRGVDIVGLSWLFVQIVVVITFPFQIILCDVPLFLEGDFEERNLWVVAAPLAIKGVFIEESEHTEVAFVNASLNLHFQVKHVLNVTYRLAEAVVMVQAPSGLVVDGAEFVSNEVKAKPELDDAQANDKPGVRGGFCENTGVQNEKVFLRSDHPKHQSFVPNRQVHIERQFNSEVGLGYFHEVVPEDVTNRLWLPVP